MKASSHKCRPVRDRWQVPAWLDASPTLTKHLGPLGKRVDTIHRTLRVGRDDLQFVLHGLTAGTPGPGCEGKIILLTHVLVLLPEANSSSTRLSRPSAPQILQDILPDSLSNYLVVEYPDYVLPLLSVIITSICSEHTVLLSPTLLASCEPGDGLSRRSESWIWDI